MTNDEILAKAKRDYPVGTEVICLKGDNGCAGAGIITKQLKFYQNGHISHADLCGYVYANGEWAEIVSKPSEATSTATNTPSSEPYSFIPAKGDIVKYVGNRLFTGYFHSEILIEDVEGEEVWYTKDNGRKDWINIAWFNSPDNTPQFIKISTKTSYDHFKQGVGSIKLPDGNWNPELVKQHMRESWYATQEKIMEKSFGIPTLYGTGGKISGDDKLFQNNSTKRQPSNITNVKISKEINLKINKPKQINLWQQK